MTDISMLLIAVESFEEKMDLVDRIWSLWPECRVVQVNDSQVGVVCPHNKVLEELRERFKGTVFNGVHDITQVVLHELSHFYVAQNPEFPDVMKSVLSCGVELRNSETGTYKRGWPVEGIPVPRAWKHAGKSGLIERIQAEKFLDAAEDAMFKGRYWESDGRSGPPEAELLEYMSDVMQEMLEVFESQDWDSDNIELMPNDIYQPLYMNFMGMWALHKEAVKSRPEWPALAKYIHHPKCWDEESLKPKFLRKDEE